MALYKLTMESARRRLQVLSNILTSRLKVQRRNCSSMFIHILLCYSH